MARAAAKRTKRPSEAARPQPKRANAPKPIEKTLFFSRIRRQTKWVFVLLAVVFALSFVVAGVGSGSTGFGSIVDALGGIFGTSKGSSNTPSVDDAQKRIGKNPKDAAAYRDLARAYELKGDDILAIGALTSYLKLTVPKDARISALNELAGLYETRARLQYQEAQSALYDVQTAEGGGFGPSATSPFGKAFANDPIKKAQIAAAQATYQQVYTLLQDTLQNLETTYKGLTDADPTDPSYLILYAQSAQQAGDSTGALAAYKLFLKKFPDDPSAADVRRAIKQLTPPKPAKSSKSKSSKSSG